MSTLMLVATMLNPWSAPTNEPVVCGEVKYYSPGVMGRVADNRGMNLGGYTDGVALMSCGDLGRDVWLEWAGETVGPFLVVDRAQRDHFDRRLEQGDVAEVSFAQALLWGMAGPIDACVWFVQPPPLRWI